MRPKPVYGVLKGSPHALALDDDASPHIEIKVQAGGAWHRVAVNARSAQPPHDLLFKRLDPFKHRMTRYLRDLPSGLTPLTTGKRRMLALDYPRMGVVRRAHMKVAPYRMKGPSNDLREFVGLALAKAVKAKDSTIYAFGETWGPEHHRPDQYFGFSPGQGVHDVHMNQGSPGRFRAANRPRQDGALLLHFARQDRWIALFLAFQSQSWRNDPRTGHPLG